MAGSNDTTAIVGLGLTEMGKIYDRTAADFAGESLALALADARLTIADVDGLLVNWSMSSVGPGLHQLLGLRDLGLVGELNSYGATAGLMMLTARAAIETGQATTVALIFADAPLRRDVSAAAAYAVRGELGSGLPGLRSAYGAFGATTAYALGARRHMHLYGTTSEQLGAIAVAERRWANLNPRAQMRGQELTLEEHQSSRWVVEPLHLFDCCLVSNGAVCVIVTSGERAKALNQPPVFVRGIGQAAPGDNARVGIEPLIQTGAKRSGAAALRQAGISLADVDVVELYDCYTYTVLVSLEDYGFCDKGEGGPFVADGRLEPGGGLAVNTGGGQLSGYYMWGFTPLSEGIIQARGQGGERQVNKHDHVLVSGNGGTLTYHSTMILSRHEN